MLRLIHFFAYLKKENQYFHMQCMSYFNEDYTSLFRLCISHHNIILSDNDED